MVNLSIDRQLDNKAINYSRTDTLQGYFYVLDKHSKVYSFCNTGVYFMKMKCFEGKYDVF